MAWTDKQSGDLIEASDINYIANTTEGLKSKETKWDGTTDETIQARTDYKGVAHNTLNKRLIADNSIENLQDSKTYKYGYQISVNGQPQLIYEEVIV